jgi:mono/diheme cytochrome c family protein
MPRLSSMLVILAAITGCGASSERAEQIANLTGDPSAGASLYITHCERCHGEDGQSGSAGVDLVGELHHGDAELIDVMILGKESMPSFSQQSDQELADLLAHLRSLDG